MGPGTIPSAPIASLEGKWKRTDECLYDTQTQTHTDTRDTQRDTDIHAYMMTHMTQTCRDKKTHRDTHRCICVHTHTHTHNIHLSKDGLEPTSPQDALSVEGFLIKHIQKMLHVIMSPPPPPLQLKVS